MSTLLSPEVVLKLSPEYKRLLLSTITLQELTIYVNPAYKRFLLNQEQEKRKAAVCEVLEQILKRYLGPMPVEVSNELHECALTDLAYLVNVALDATTWDEFVDALPANADGGSARLCSSTLLG